MREQRIRVLKLAPGKAPQVVELENTLEGLQNAVAEGMTDRGMIELVRLPHVDVLLIHEEGKLLNLPVNRRLSSFGYETSDVLCGNVFICAEIEDEDDVHLASLPEDRLKEYAEQFAEPEDIDQSEVEKNLRVGFMFF